MNNPTLANSPRDLDAILDAFECADGQASGANIAAYLPEAGDPAFDLVATELIRVDLERSWARGSKKRIEAYRGIAAPLFSNRLRLSEIAFEEYRLRRQAGEPVSSAEYAHRYSIDTSNWPADEREGSNGVAAAATISRVGNGQHSKPHDRTFPRAGEKFGGFELVEELGRGAFGVVFLARQADLAAREVVLKITAPRSVEPQRLARLQHTNIVPLYSIHEYEGFLAICMPYFGRQTLGDLLRAAYSHAEQATVSTVVEHDAQTLPISTTARVESKPVELPSFRSGRPSTKREIAQIVDRLAQLAEGLAHAHARGIVHSDLKPANVLLTDDGVPMLLDFNLSSDTSSAYQQATLLVGGTLPYMAPEHLLATLDGSAVTPPSDVFSLGVIAFELLTGRRPYPEHAGEFGQVVDQLVADRRGAVPSPKKLNSQVSDGLASIVMRCLSPTPRNRYATASELADDLRRYQQDLPLQHAPDRSLHERSAKWFRRNARGVRWTAAAALIALLASLSAMYIARQHRLGELESATAFSDFDRDAEVALTNMYAPGSDPELVAIGRAAAEQALDRFQLMTAGPDASAKFARLSHDQQIAVRRQGEKLLYALAADVAANVSSSSKQRGSKESALKAALQYNNAAASLRSSGAEPKALLEQRAALFAASGDEPNAAKMHELAAQAAPADQDKFLDAVALFDRRQYSEAVAAAELTCRENPHDPSCWLLLGDAYFGVGRLPNAEACYTALVALQPKSVPGYLYRGLCRMEQQNLTGAEQDYSEALVLNPTLATTRINRALVYLAMHNLAAAERDATSAIDSGLADPRGYFVRAVIRDAMGKSAEAKSDRERGFHIPAVDDKGWVARGIALLGDDPQQAAAEFEQGIALYPHSKPLLQNLMHVYGDRLNRLDDALKSANALVLITPTNSSALAGRAVLLARKGEVEAATADAVLAVANQPTPLTSLQLACVYSLLSPQAPSATNEALQSLRQALTRDPKLATRAASDPDLAALRNNTEFQSLLAAAMKLSGVDSSSWAPATKPLEQAAPPPSGDAKKEQS